MLQKRRPDWSGLGTHVPVQVYRRWGVQVYIFFLASSHGSTTTCSSWLHVRVGFAFGVSRHGVWPAGQSLHSRPSKTPSNVSSVNARRLVDVTCQITFCPHYICHVRTVCGWAGIHVNSTVTLSVKPNRKRRHAHEVHFGVPVATTPYHANFSSRSSILPARFDPPKPLPAGSQTLCVCESSVGRPSVMHQSNMRTCKEAI
jgi:hypothetical protein